MLRSSMELLSLNVICLCSCLVIISYVWKLRSFLKFGISILIPNYIPNYFFAAFLNVVSVQKHLSVTLSIVLYDLKLLWSDQMAVKI